MIAIEIIPPSREFVVGQPIHGRVRWSTDDGSIESLDIRLIWFTKGKGDRDLAVVEQQEIAATKPEGEAAFEFAAPSKPFSFSGKLISLIWAIEALAAPSRESDMVEIVIGPTGKEVRLGRGETAS